MPVNLPQLPPIDDVAFRNVIGHFASGVTIITTTEGDQLFGTTVSAFSSLSVDPPMVLVCLNQSSSTHDALLSTGKFAANVLSSAQGELAVRFARPLDNRFEGLRLETGAAGQPLLPGRLAGMECAVEETHVGGTHTVFFGRVLSAEAHLGEPLAYYRGQFGEFHETRERHAFLAARRWILQRAVTVGREVDLEHMASDFGITTTTVYNTLMRLTAAGLVDKNEADGSFTVTPLTADAVDGVYRTRYALESGVIDKYLSDATDDEIASLVLDAQKLAAMPLETSGDLEAFLERNLDFHAAVVGLAHSRDLVDRFRECSLAAAWLGTYDDKLWQERRGHNLLASYVRALSERDVDAAKGFLREQNDLVRGAARSAVHAWGGVF